MAAPFVISGCIGPRDDGRTALALMELREALGYHSEQIATLADTEADLVSALTMTHAGEAIGVTRAAAALRDPGGDLLHCGDGRPAAIRGIPRRGGPDGGRGNQRSSLLLHDQLCSPQPLRVRARHRPGLGAAARRYTNERLPQEPCRNWTKPANSTPAIRTSWRATTSACCQHARMSQCWEAVAVPITATSRLSLGRSCQDRPNTSTPAPNPRSPPGAPMPCRLEVASSSARCG